MNGSLEWWKCTAEDVLLGLQCKREDLLSKMDPPFLGLYKKIIRKLPTTEVNADEDFQNEFREFFVPRRARRSFDCFSDRYFALMQTYKEESSVSFDFVLKELFRDSRPRVEKSFASKLVHVINRDKPVLDSRVERALCFDSEKYNSSTAKAKLVAAKQVYSELESLARGIMGQKEGFEELLGAFDRTFLEFDYFTPMKKLDFYLWTYGRTYGSLAREE